MPRGARLVYWTQPELAEAAGLEISTVIDFERDGRRVSEEAVAGIRSALEKAGVAFTNGKRPGVRLK